jgi:hypothetical protein
MTRAQPFIGETSERRLIASWRQSKIWIKKHRYGVASNIFLLSVIIASFQAWVDVYDANSPSVTFNYEDNERYIVPVPNPTPSRIVIFMEIITSRRLQNAIPYLVSIHPIKDVSAVPLSANPLRSNQRMTLGWYSGHEPEPWQPRSIAKNDTFIPFNILHDGTQLALFTNSDAVELNAAFQSIPPGNYMVVFEIDDSTLEHGALQAFDLKWSGKTDGFSMKKID